MMMILDRVSVADTSPSVVIVTALRVRTKEEPGPKTDERKARAIPRMKVDGDRAGIIFV